MKAEACATISYVNPLLFDTPLKCNNGRLIILSKMNDKKSPFSFLTLFVSSFAWQGSGSKKCDGRKNSASMLRRVVWNVCMRVFVIFSSVREFGSHFSAVKATHFIYRCDEIRLLGKENFHEIQICSSKSSPGITRKKRMDVRLCDILGMC